VGGHAFDTLSRCSLSDRSTASGTFRVIREEHLMAPNTDERDPQRPDPKDEEQREAIQRGDATERNRRAQEQNREQNDTVDLKR